MSKFENYLNEATARVMVFVDTTLHMGAKIKSNIVVQDMGSKLKILDIGFDYATNEGQAKGAIDLAASYGARVINVWKTLLSHHVVQWIKNYRTDSNMRVDHIEDATIGSKYAADIGYDGIKSNFQAAEWQGVINKYRGVRANLFCIFSYLKARPVLGEEVIVEYPIDEAAKVTVTQNLLTGIQACTKVKEALEKAGFKRTSGYSGGEVRGWTNSLGSTGFSVRKDGNLVDWHVIISGKSHLPYENYSEIRPGDDERVELHRPVNPQSLEPKIAAVFKKLGMKVKKVRYSGHQGMWDDDVTYNVSTERPDWLSDKN
jgi:hypothetical protein